jgi:hypothetical protein
MKRKGFIVFLVLALLLAGCSNTTPAPATPTLPAGATATVAVAATSIPPTPTSVPGKVLLLAPTPDDPLAVILKTHLATLAAASQLTSESHTTLQPADLTPEVRIVVLLAAPNNLNDLLSAAPKTQFVLLGSAGGTDPQPNLSVIRQDPDQLTFVAGYVATIISGDWRSAALLPDSPATLQQAFVNGGGYWCGRCAPIHGPIVIFPLVSVLPKDSAPAAWADALTKLKTNILEALYFDPSISSPDLLKLLGEQTFVLVGGQSPTSDALRQHWAATVSSDLLAPLDTLWPGLLAGTGGKSVAAAITLSDVNPDLLTPGKQLLVQQVITSLASGTLSALTPQ